MAKVKSKKTEIRELDEMWTKKVKDRDNWECQICHKKVVAHNCQAHHILPKQIRGVRWDTDNGITLCYQHHRVGQFSAHQNAVWFAFWLKTNKPNQFKHVIEKLKKIGEIVR